MCMKARLGQDSKAAIVFGHPRAAGCFGKGNVSAVKEGEWPLQA